MKRIVTLLLAAGLVMGAYTGAQAADVKVSGKWNFGFHFMSDVNHDHESEDDFDASQRLRLQLDIIASENLKGVVFFEIGNSTWGEAGNGADLGADDTVVEVKRSYIDWTAPNTDLKIRMGVQGLALPSAAFGNPIFDEDVAAITMSYAFNDTFALTGFWARPYDGGLVNLNDKYSHDGNDEMDMFGLIAPISLDGHAITPYFVYAAIGDDTNFGKFDANGNGVKDADLVLNDDVDAYWFGVAYSMTAFDPFTLDVDFIYGSADSDNKLVDTAGWMVDFKAAYALDFMTPAIIGWYASGADGKDDIDGLLPTIPGQPGCWYPTSFGFVGSCYQEDTHIGETPNGSWALGLELADISFIEDLTHVFRFVYMEGTNDKNFAANAAQEAAFGDNLLSEDDSAIEMNFDSTYQIYENLAFILELGLIDYDLKNDVDQETAYKATFNFVYSF